MISQTHGGSISETEVTNISTHGIWIYVNGKEFFLSYKEYPWFKQATIKEICSVEFLHDRHLHWSALDVDLEIASLENPQRYPLVYK